MTDVGLDRAIGGGRDGRVRCGRVVGLELSLKGQRLGVCISNG